MANEIAYRDSNQVPVLLAVDDTTGEIVRVPTDANGNLLCAATVAGGITGPGSSTDNAVVRWNGAGGTAVKNSTVIIGDTGNVTGLGTLNTLTLPSSNFVGLTDSQTLTNKTLTSPTMTTPTLGVASATSINKVAITAPATSATLTIADGKTFTANDSVTVGTGGVVLGNSGGFTAAASKVLTVNKSITLDGTDSTTMTFPSTSGTVLTADSTATLTNKTIGVSQLSGQVSVSNGGTGASSLTAYAVLCGGTTSTGAVQSIAGVGTSGQVLTSNGAGALPTFQTAGGASPRRSYAFTMDMAHLTSSGTVAPTDVTGLNGIQCSMNTNGGSSAFSVNFIDETSYSMYDNNPEINFASIYDAGSATGGGKWYAGDTGGSTNPTLTQTTKSMFAYAETVAGTLTWYAVNANGTTNTNASLSGVSAGIGNTWRIVKNSTTNIKWYVNGVLKSTSTTNLPSGNSNSSSMVMFGVKNDAGDTTTRTSRFGFCELILDSPNS